MGMGIGEASLDQISKQEVLENRTIMTITNEQQTLYMAVEAVGELHEVLMLGMLVVEEAIEQVGVVLLAGIMMELMGRVEAHMEYLI
jgi:hypothetical protein